MSAANTESNIYSRLKTALNASMDGIALLDASGNYYYLNPEHITMFGYEKEEELLGKSWQYIYDEAEIERINKDIFPLLIQHKQWRGETTGKSKNGSPVYQEISLTLTEEGEIICICRDIRNKLDETRKLMLHNEIMEQTKSMIIITNPQQEIEWVNRSFCEISGYSLEECIGKKPGSLLQGKDSNQNVISGIRQNIKDRKPFQAELLNYKKDGTPYWIEIKGQPLFNDRGALEHFFAIEEDITPRKEYERRLLETQQKLEESEALYRKSMEAIGAAIWEWDLINDKVYATQEFRKIFGLPASEAEFSISNKTLIPLVHPDDAEKLDTAFQDHFSGKSQKLDIDYRLKRPDTGQYEWYNMQGAVIETNAANIPSKAMGYFISIQERKMVEMQLKESEERWYNAMAVSGAGFWEYNIGNDTFYFSTRMKAILGYVNTNHIPENIGYWETMIHPEDLDPLKEKIKSSVSGSAPSIQTEFRIRNKEEEYIWVSLSGMVRFSDEGIALKYSGAAYDITVRKMAEMAMEKARQMAESSVKAKRRFLANVSHEIRTPMHAIMGLSEQLLLSDMRPEQKALMQMIAEASKALMNIINDVLDLSKIEEGKLQIDETIFDPATLMQQVTDLFSVQAAKKELTFILHKPDLLKRACIGDSSRIRQVLANIISNAIKFTDKGKIEIGFDISDHNEKEVMLSFTCSDTGVGMSEEMKKRIFEEFVQEDESFHRKYGGSGLGLSITHELVKLMNGTIDIESQKNKGTTVRIKIPLTIITDQKSTPSIPLKVDSAALQQLSLLVAEDNEFNRLLLKFILEKNKIPYDFAENGKIAVEKACAQHYDLILMDIQMPEMDGIGATQIIRERLGNKIPIIAVTANAIKEELDYYLTKGLTDYITKPFEERKLLEMIQHFVVS